MKMGFVGGIIAGAIVGSAITMVMDPVSDRDRKKLKKGTKNFARKVNYVIDMMKWCNNNIFKSKQKSYRNFL